MTGGSYYFQVDLIIFKPEADLDLTKNSNFIDIEKVVLVRTV